MYVSIYIYIYIYICIYIYIRVNEWDLDLIKNQHFGLFFDRRQCWYQIVCGESAARARVPAVQVPGTILVRRHFQGMAARMTTTLCEVCHLFRALGTTYIYVYVRNSMHVCGLNAFWMCAVTDRRYQAVYFASHKGLVTGHKLHVTRHTAQVTSYMLHVRSHRSQVTGQVTGHTLHVTFYTSHCKNLG